MKNLKKLGVSLSKQEQRNVMGGDPDCNIGMPCDCVKNGQFYQVWFSCCATHEDINATMQCDSGYPWQCGLARCFGS